MAQVTSDVRVRLKPLEADGPSALRDLRRVCGTLLESLPPMGRAVELADVLKLDRSLAWKVWKVAQGSDDLPSPKHVPGRAGMSIFLKAAEQQGAPQERIEAVREAHARLEGIFKNHAGDRASADILLGRFTDEGRSRLEMELRRDAFRANSHFLGVRARTRHQLDLIAPAAGPFMPQIARIRGYYGLQRTRADARWVLSRSYVIQQSGTAGAYKRTALEQRPDSDDAMNSAPIARQFCSPADPPLRREQADNHTFVDELGPSPIGETGASNIVTAELISDVPYDNVSQDAAAVHIRTPSERLCYEILIHRDIVRDTTPKLEVFTTLNAASPKSPPDPRDRVPILETLRALGPSDSAPAAMEVPRHTELTSWTFERLGYVASDFLTFRFVMRYPPIPILLWVTYQLPDGKGR